MTRIMPNVVGTFSMATARTLAAQLLPPSFLPARQAFAATPSIRTATAYFDAAMEHYTLIGGVDPVFRQAVTDILPVALAGGHVFCVEYDDDLYQSVFPSVMADASQLHSSIEDALSYIREIAGDVEIGMPRA